MRAQSVLGYLLGLLLVTVGVSILIFGIFPSLEKSKAFGVVTDAIEEMRTLDKTIGRVASGDVGTEIRVALSVEEGRFVVSNGSIKFEYFTPLLTSLTGVVKREGNLMLVGGRSPGVECAIRKGDCLSGENCIFELFNLTNSHVAECGSGSGYEYKLCCKNLEVLYTTGICSRGEEVVSIFNVSNSHVGTPGYFDIKACFYPEAVCDIKENCSSGEICVFSLSQKTDTHVAECDYFPYKFCCYWRVKEGVEIFLKPPSVEIVGEGMLPKGGYQLCIKKISDGERPVVEVRVC